MSRIEQRLQELDIVLPPPMDASTLPFGLTHLEGDRVRGGRRLFGMVNVAPDFVATTPVRHAASEVILEAFGPETGRHIPSAIGVAGLPYGMPVEIEAELVIR